MIEAYKNYWKGYIDFKGRTSVGGYWWAILAHFIVSFLFSFIINLVGYSGSATFAGSFITTFMLICMPSSLAIAVRRLRDAGCSWTNIFWVFLPFAGAIVLIVKLCKPSAPAYGEPAVKSAAAIGSPAYRAPAPKTRSFVGSSAQAGFRKLPISSLQPHNGSGVCDVCGKSLEGANARIVPNSVFYSSPEWREHFRNVNGLMFARSGADVNQQIEYMRRLDKSIGSAVCSDCIHMFAE